MKRWIFTLMFGLVLCGLHAQPPAGEGNIGDTYGDVSGLRKRVKTKDITQLKENKVVKGNFKGRVEEVCQKKGCWIRLNIGEGKQATIRMKDYGFFVPVALIGKEVVVRGQAELKVTSVDELKHLAEDGGKSQDEIDSITEPEETITILATGIRVTG